MLIKACISTLRRAWSWPSTGDDRLLVEPVDRRIARGGSVSGRALIWLLVAVVVAIVGAVIASRTAGVRRQVVPEPGTSTIDAAAVVGGVSEAEVRRHLDAFSQWPSRMPGTRGHDAAAKHIRSVYDDLDLDIVEHPIQVTSPVTIYCELLDEDGRPIPGVELYPFWPNLVRTCTIPEPGIQGRVTMSAGGQGYLYDYADRDAATTIPLLNVSVTEQWIGLADAGFPAVIFFADDTARPRHYRTKELDFPGNFPRFLMVGDPKTLEGKSVRLRCRVDWQTLTVSTVIGVLEPPRPQEHEEAIILTAHYDSISAIPDLAPGGEQASALASMLASAKFAADNRDQLKRTMLFVALTAHGQACQGVRRLGELWGQPGDEAATRAQTDGRIDELMRQMDLLEGERALLENAAYWSIIGEQSSEQERLFWQDRSAELRDVFLDDIRRVIESQVDEAQEQMIDADLARKRSGSDAGSPLATLYEQSRQRVESLRFAATATLLDLKTHHGLGDDAERRSALRLRLDAKRDRLTDDLERMRSSREAQQLLHRFDRYITLSLAVTSGVAASGTHTTYPTSRRSASDASGWLGAIGAGLFNDMRPLVPAIARATLTDEDVLQNPAKLFQDGVNHHVPYPEPSLRAGSMNYEIAYSYEHLPLLGQGRHAIAWLTPADSAKHMGTPEDTFDRLNHENLLCTTRMIAAATARMGAGHVPLNATPHLPRVKAAKGQVLQAADPNSVIPTRGVERALLVARHGGRLKVLSVRQEDVIATDADGRFAFPPSDSLKPPTMFDAFRLDAPTGQIMAVKDMGEKGEASFPTARTWNNFDNPLRIVLFRCAQTDLFYPLHPSTSVGLGSAFSVETSTLTTPQSFAAMTGNPFAFHWGDIHRVAGQGFSLFNPPTTQLYYGLRSKSPLDPTLESVVAYLLGDVKLDTQPPQGREIWGPGYLAHDTPRLTMWQRQAAASMVAVDGYRLRRQEKHRVADPIQLDQHNLAADLSEKANAAYARGDFAAAVHAAQDSLAISMEVYPRIAQTERDAVIGVLFYLFLVIPFSIFMERLLFGFADIRTQIAGVIGVFAVVFVALRYLHPAFELVSSGMMVLVGFLTLALSLFVTLFLFGKFQRNIKELRLKLQRTAEAADVSRFAAAGTAFLLGINNMRKRKVRTAFTCVTLVLVTFALLSLTAVRRASKFKYIAVGRAPYTGLLISCSATESLPGTAALVERFGQKASVSRVYWQEGSNAGIAKYGGMGVSLGGPGESGTEKYPSFAHTNSIGFDLEEINVTNIGDALTAGRWFASDSERTCILPLNLATKLGVTEEMALAEQTVVNVNGAPYTLIGFFDPDKLERVYDLDGQSLLPFDGTTIAPQKQGAGAEKIESQIALPEQIPRLPGEQVVLLPAQDCSRWVARLAINLGDMAPGEAMEQIREFLDRWEGYVYFGIGGVAYYGRIYRGMQIEGIAEILVPLLIAGAIVLNTMLGSVYERTSEIGVYSAVGLSPSHVRYLFLAEACVYATVGAVAGYLLAHGLGTGAAAVGLTGGLSFNYSTLSTVYATMALIGAVLISTWYPARKAAKLASPSQRTAIEVPAANGDELDVDLPFTYVELDAISVIPFLHDVLEDHGEGSSAEFFCQPPDLVVGEQPRTLDALPADTTIDLTKGFGLAARCWLKPYDLGVSQQVTLMIRPTKYENVWSAQMHLQRLSGDLDSWRRANQLFVSVLRKHFLSWRGLEDEQKDEYLVRGAAALGVTVERLGQSS